MHIASRQKYVKNITGTYPIKEQKTEMKLKHVRLHVNIEKQTQWTFRKYLLVTTSNLRQ